MSEFTHRPKRAPSDLGKMLIFVAVAVIGLTWCTVELLGMVSTSLADHTPEAAPATPVPEKPPEKSPEDKLADKVTFDTCIIYAGIIDRNAIQWISILADDNATTVCLRYSGRNGFGGMSAENAVIHHGKISYGVASWNQHCAHRRMHDMTWDKININPAVCSPFLR